MINLLLNVRDLAHAAAHELLAHVPGAAVVYDQTSDAPSCVAGHRPHPATDGRLCRWHLEELGRWLRDIEREVRQLDPAPSMSTSWDGGSSSLASQQSPVRLDAVVYTDPRSTLHGHRHVGPVCNRCPALTGRRCTCPPLEWQRQVHYAGCPRHGAHASCLIILADGDEREARAERLVYVLGVLHGWADRVRGERMLGQPVTTVIDRIPGAIKPVCACTTCQAARWIRHIPIPPTIASERDLLSRNLDWIAKQNWVTDMRRELADVRDQLLRANHNEDDQPLPGWCNRLVDGQECGGELWPAEPEHTSGYESAEGYRAVVCKRNEKHRWEGVALARLSLIIQEQQGGKGTAS